MDVDLQFHPGVEFEIKSSYQWYQSQANGLGENFLDELESGYQTIRELPDVWPIFQKGFNRYLLAKFPFAIIYRKTTNCIYIVAVMHTSRKPHYWINRPQSH